MLSEQIYIYIYIYNIFSQLLSTCTSHVPSLWASWILFLDCPAAHAIGRSQRQSILPPSSATLVLGDTWLSSAPSHYTYQPIGLTPATCSQVSSNLACNQVLHVIQSTKSASNLALYQHSSQLSIPRHRLVSSQKNVSWKPVTTLVSIHVHVSTSFMLAKGVWSKFFTKIFQKWCWK